MGSRHNELCENEVDAPHEKWGKELIDTFKRLVVRSKVGAYN
jgi:hypothetical protein